MTVKLLQLDNCLYLYITTFADAGLSTTVTCTVTATDVGGLTDTATLYIYISKAFEISVNDYVLVQMSNHACVIGLVVVSTHYRRVIWFLQY